MHSPLPSLFLLFLCFAHGAIGHGGRTQDHCPPTTSRCSHGPSVRFPFWLEGQQDARCGYPGFELFCEGGWPNLLVPNTTRRLVVKSIDYDTQSLLVSDPTQCLPLSIESLNRLGFYASQDVSLSQDRYDYTLFKCPPPDRTGMTEVKCRSGQGYKVYAVESSSYVGDSPLVYCERNGSLDPMPNPISDMIEEALFHWDKPDCKPCQRMRQSCVRNENGSDSVVCIPLPPGHRGIVSCVFVLTL